MARRQSLMLAGALVAGAVVGLVAGGVGGGGGGGELGSVASEHGLSHDEAEAALATFTPPGEHDEYMMFASGGHSGQIHVIGVPSMSLLKTIPVFSSDAWSGYGYGADSGEELFEQGSDPAKTEELRWGDAHHPALSETDGDYDGRFIYINDRANGRLGMVDLRDFKTKQILDIPNIQTSHGGVFATPDTDYVHISSMTPAPFGMPDGFAELEDIAEDFRGVSTFVAIDPETGLGDMSKSFQIELPPYTQDLADAGKLASDGFAFINSYNTEMGTATEVDGVPLETSATKNDYDFMHVIDWKKAADVAASGKVETINGVRMITLQTAIDEALLHFIPEPRNPHGVDVSPTGDYITVSGKLDPRTSIYDIELIKDAIAEKNYQGKDQYGVPILDLDSVLAGQVEVGAGPLHTQYDADGNAYTSLFVESAIAKWTLGPKAGIEGDGFELVDKVAVNYNIGHLVTAEGDTVSPDGKYAVALNKWSVDRFQTVGTLHPQNFQLIDIAGEKMRVLKDMPIGFGEPHYVQIVKADKITAWDTYPAGTDPLAMASSEFAVESGGERIERDGTDVHVYMTAMRSHFTPDVVRVKKGDNVTLHITNIETAKDATHGFAIPGHNIQASLDPGEVVNIEFTAERSGDFAFYCTEFCSALHLEMQGWLLVEP